MARAGGGNFLPLISAAFVDSGTPGSPGSPDFGSVQKVVVKHRWTSGQLAPKDDFSVCCIIKKSFSLFLPSARAVLFVISSEQRAASALHYFPFAIF